MKTLIKKLNLGILMIGLVILASCGRNYTAVSVAGINMVQSTIPSMVTTATKYTGLKISKYFKSSPEVKNENGPIGKKVEKTARSHKFMPITIGNPGACLISSNGL
jgi:hypothetical protein